MGYNFRTALRGRIGIRAAKTICFAIAPDPFVIAVAFVGCDYHPALICGSPRMASSTFIVPSIFVSKVATGAS